MENLCSPWPSDTDLVILEVSGEYFRFNKRYMARTFPIIDLFAGPGGLSEGFSFFENTRGHRPFRVRLSIEKEEIPHRTLELRAFFRQFCDLDVPEEYYDYLRGTISRDELFAAFPEAAMSARKEAWCAELGKTPHEEVMARIRAAMRIDCDKWVLIGGPPCQAYSLAGRSRRKNDVAFADDKRHFLYIEYLRIIAERQPAVFVMENVQGILSSTAEDEHIFGRILRDLKRPRAALGLDEPDTLGYRLYSLNGEDEVGDTAPRLFEDEAEATDARTFLVRADRYDIPQARPRVFVLGVRSDLPQRQYSLQPGRDGAPTVSQAIGDLPPLRSRISRGGDSQEEWQGYIRSLCDQPWLGGADISQDLRDRLCTTLNQLHGDYPTGQDWLPQIANPQWKREWYFDQRLGGICNHEARGHMKPDLWRYFFASTYAQVIGRSPLLRDFPQPLRPLHGNVEQSVQNNDLFSDRFRVQLQNKPSTTIVSHISKDGHYYIHYDPLQCRSLTVREAARLQTFKDNYFFEGPRTAQYHQVGNAVPPLLARQIAGIVYRVLQP